MASWQIDGETMETVRNFILGGSKITADGDCSHEIKRCLLLGRKATFIQLEEFGIKFYAFMLNKDFLKFTVFILISIQVIFKF